MADIILFRRFAMSLTAKQVDNFASDDDKDRLERHKEQDKEQKSRYDDRRVDESVDQRKRRVKQQAQLKDDRIDDGQLTAAQVAGMVLEGLFAVALGVLAAYLSWASNSAIGWAPAFKVIFAVVAFFFSTTYLFGHLLFKIDMLEVIRKSYSPDQSSRSRVQIQPSSLAPQDTRRNNTNGNARA